MGREMKREISGCGWDWEAVVAAMSGGADCGNNGCGRGRGGNKCESEIERGEHLLEKGRS